MKGLFQIAKNLVFLGLLILGLATVMEMGARAVSYISPLPETQTRLYMISSDPKFWQIAWGEDIQPHPYFGYGRQGTIRNIDQLKTWPKHSDNFVIILTGGSVAEHFGEFAQTDFSAKLQAAVPALRGKNVTFYNFALGGYKQPQQYFLTNYLLEKIDLVINLDGVNEMNTFPGSNAKPMEMPLFTLRFFDSNTNGRMYLWPALAIRSFYRMINSGPENLPWLAASHSYFYLWSAIRSPFHDLFRKLERKYVRTFPKHQEAFAALGEEGETTAMVESWKKYIRLTNTVTKVSGVRFISFVQPNQYLPGSKPFSNEEKSVALGAYAETAARRMTQLSKASGVLRAEGIPVYSLMGIFQNVREPIYIDSCCHVNERGNQILSAEIIKTIAENFGSTPN